MVGIRGRYIYSHARDTWWVLEGVTAMQGTHGGY